jgi:hypothetical protein
VIMILGCGANKLSNNSRARHCGIGGTAFQTVRSPGGTARVAIGDHARSLQ